MDDLKQAGCIAVEGGQVRFLASSYGPQAVNEQRLAVASLITARHGDTMTHNLTVAKRLCQLTTDLEHLHTWRFAMKREERRRMHELDRQRTREFILEIVGKRPQRLVLFVAEALDVEPTMVAAVIQAMVREGKLCADGNGSRRRYWLPGTPPPDLQ